MSMFSGNRLREGKKLALVFCLLPFFLTGCDARMVAPKVQVWLSRPDIHVWLTEQPELSFSSDNHDADFTITIDEKTTYQQMDGFGASLTDSSCWLLYYKLSDAKRNEVLSRLFGPAGINVSILRQPMGSCDFAWESWTYDDTSGSSDDWSLADFSLLREDAYIRPMLAQAYQVNPGRLKLFASPWSPPAWMRSNKGLFGDGGYLRPECYSVYADYFVKYIQHYAVKGTPIYAVTIQNEPKNAPPSYPGMMMSTADQIGFIRNYLGPKLVRNNLAVKIICYDHNYDDFDYPQAVLAGAGNYCSGAAFHPYSPVSHSNLTTVHNNFPDKDIWLTEAASGAWVGDEVAQFQCQMMHSIRFPRNWSKSVVWWNVALDQNAGPKLTNVDPGNTNCGLLCIRSDSTDTVAYNASYYSLGHSSKFVDPGAYRIESNSWDDTLENVAYRNPDGSLIVVVSNRTDSIKNVELKWGLLSCVYNVPAVSAVTFKWRKQ